MGSIDETATENAQDTHDPRERNAQATQDTWKGREPSSDGNATRSADHGAPNASVPHSELRNGDGSEGSDDEWAADRNGASNGTNPAATIELNTSGTMTDEELASIVDELETSITVVGCGGAGSNTVTRMTDEGIHGAALVAANTDAQHLAEEARADTKVLLGQRCAGGRGAGSDPAIGEEAAQENIEDVIDVVRGEDMVFITAGLGGGTGIPGQRP